MKTNRFLILTLVIGLYLPKMMLGQGTLYLSKLDQLSDGSAALGSDAWIAQSFGTGTNLDGYTLNSVQLLISPASGNPTGFSIAVYAHRPGDSRFPGSLLGTLSGPDPAPGGIFSYVTAGISLSRATTYFLVLTAATPVVNGAYSWSSVSSFSYSASGGWGMAGGFHYSSADGLAWSRLGGGEFQFAIYATPIPEPTTFVLAGLGLVGLSFWRRKRRPAK